VRQQILNLYNTGGFQLIQSGDIANAQAAFLKVLGIDANDRTALYYYVQIAMQSNQIPEAKKIIAQADKNTAIYEFLSGLLKENVREHELALKHFRAAWAKEAFDLYAEKLYSIYTTRQDKPAIYALIKEWEKRLPNSSQVILLSAMLEQEDGNQSEAIKRYEKLLGLVPDNVVALNNLAWLYLEVDGNKAETLAKSAADLAPSSVDVLDTYAWALFKNNKLEKALEVIQYASELAPDNAMVREHLDVIQQAARAR
jgi:tetratricopeptide (TPR) repeat protein